MDLSSANPIAGREAGSCLGARVVSHEGSTVVVGRNLTQLMF